MSGLGGLAILLELIKGPLSHKILDQGANIQIFIRGRRGFASGKLLLGRILLSPLGRDLLLVLLVDDDVLFIYFLIDVALVVGALSIGALFIGALVVGALVVGALFIGVLFIYFLIDVALVVVDVLVGDFLFIHFIFGDVLFVGVLFIDVLFIDAALFIYFLIDVALVVGDVLVGDFLFIDVLFIDVVLVGGDVLIGDVLVVAVLFIYFLIGDVLVGAVLFIYFLFNIALVDVARFNIVLIDDFLFLDIVLVVLVRFACFNLNGLSGGLVLVWLARIALDGHNGRRVLTKLVWLTCIDLDGLNGWRVLTKLVWLARFDLYHPVAYLQGFNVACLRPFPDGRELVLEHVEVDLHASPCGLISQLGVRNDIGDSRQGLVELHDGGLFRGLHVYGLRGGVLGHGGELQRLIHIHFHDGDRSRLQDQILDHLHCLFIFIGIVFH